MRLLLVRHGETVWNALHRIQGGYSDIELSPKGRDQVEKLAQALCGESLQAVYSSPLSRAQDTAQAIARYHHLEVRLELAFREVDTGRMDGLSIDEVKQKFPEFWQNWLQGEGSLVWPGGESLEEVALRVGEGLLRLREKHPQDTLVLVSHVFALCTLILHTLGLPASYFRHFYMEPASLTILKLDGEQASLVQLNDTCHWRGCV